MYYNINKLMERAEKLSIWKTIWIGIKIATLMIPTLWAISYFILGR